MCVALDFRSPDARTVPGRDCTSVSDTDEPGKLQRLLAKTGSSRQHHFPVNTTPERYNTAFKEKCCIHGYHDIEENPRCRSRNHGPGKSVYTASPCPHPVEFRKNCERDVVENGLIYRISRLGADSLKSASCMKETVDFTVVAVASSRPQIQALQRDMSCPRRPETLNPTP